jgi:hypothetical protein
MVYNNQDYWVFKSSSLVRYSEEHNLLRSGSASILLHSNVCGDPLTRLFLTLCYPSSNPKYTRSVHMAVANILNSRKFSLQFYVTNNTNSCKSPCCVSVCILSLSLLGKGSVTNTHAKRNPSSRRETQFSNT